MAPELDRLVHDLERLRRIGEFLEFLVSSEDEDILGAIDNWVDVSIQRGRDVLSPYLGPASRQYFGMS